MSETQVNPELDSADVAELMEALSSPDKAAALMARHGWTQDDLLAKAEYVSKKLAAGIANVNCV
jgi:hypothetical protein